MQVCSACNLECCPLPLTELPKETELLQWTDSAEVRGVEVHLICFSFTETELECCPHGLHFILRPGFLICYVQYFTRGSVRAGSSYNEDKVRKESCKLFCHHVCVPPQKVVMGEMSQRASQTSRSCHNTCMKKERCWRH